jgi:hypothetical protein
MTQPVEISEKNDRKVSNRYCKHLGSKSPPFFVVFKLHAGLTTFNVYGKRCSRFDYVVYHWIIFCKIENWGTFSSHPPNVAIFIERRE